MSVEITREGPTAIITINRPERRNAVDAATAHALFDAFSAFDADDTASVAILTGAGGAFCAGADLKALAEGESGKRIERGGVGSFAPMGPSRMRLSKPVIAAFPQTCMRHDRLSAIEQWDLDESAAIENEIAHGLVTLRSGETVSVAQRFSSGEGRHGKFD